MAIQFWNKGGKFQSSSSCLSLLSMALDSLWNDFSSDEWASPALFPTDVRVPCLDLASIWSQCVDTCSQNVCLINTNLYKVIVIDSFSALSMENGRQTITDCSYRWHQLEKAEDHSLVGGSGLGPPVQAVHIIVPHPGAIWKDLLALHAQSLAAQTPVPGFQIWGNNETSVKISLDS